MALRFITNTVYRDCARPRRDGADIVSGQIYNLIGGPVYLGYGIQHTSDADHLTYQRNDDYVLTADTCVIGPGADTLTDLDDYAISSLDESLGWVDITLFNATDDASLLIGPKSDCFCFTFDKITDASAYRLKWVDAAPTDDTFTIQKLYFSESFEFGSDHNIEQVRFDRKDQVSSIGGVSYVCDYSFSIQINNVSRSDITSFKQDQYKPFNDAMFIYDSTEVYLPGKLWHVIMQSLTSEAVADNLFNITINGLRLKHYASYA